MVGLHSIKILSLVTLVVSLFFAGSMNAFGNDYNSYQRRAYGEYGYSRSPELLAPGRQVQALALLVRVPFLMAAQYHQGNNNSRSALKNKAVASGLSLLSELLDLYNNGKTDRCLYTYPWAAYDLYEMANALYEIMYAPEEIKVNDEGFDDPEMIIDQPEVQKISKIVYGLILLETYFAILPAGYNGTKEERAKGQASALREVFRGFQSLSRCGTEFFSGDKKSHKSILLAIAALASTYGIGKDFLKLADVLEKNKRSRDYSYDDYRNTYGNASGRYGNTGSSYGSSGTYGNSGSGTSSGSGSSYGSSGTYGNTGGSYGSSGTYGNTPQALSPAAERRKHLEVLGLQEGVSDAEIRRAYLQLAKQFHPDKNPDNPQESEVEFKKCKAAHDALLRK